MNSPQPLAPGEVGSEWGEGTAVDMAPIQDEVVKARSAVLAIKRVLALKADSCL